MEAHGGRIWAESDGEGLGARFTFTLPAVEEAAVPPDPSERGGQQGAPSLEDEVPVLALGDDLQGLRSVRDTLAGAGYRPVVTGDPEEALRLMQEERPALALLDLMLPGADGIELMEAVRAVADVPVIFLSAYGREDLVARAFEMGADDYIVKPSSPTELAARVQAALRRRTWPARMAPSEPSVRGDLTIDNVQRLVSVAGELARLTAAEYNLLRELFIHAGRALTHQHLLQRVWGKTEPETPRVLRTHLMRLRRRLGEDGDNPKYLFAEPRVGYRMERPDAKAPDQE